MSYNRKPVITQGEIDDVTDAFEAYEQGNGQIVAPVVDLENDTGMDRTRIEMALRAAAADYVRPVIRIGEWGNMADPESPGDPRTLVSDPTVDAAGFYVATLV